MITDHEFKVIIEKLYCLNNSFKQTMSKFHDFFQNDRRFLIYGMLTYVNKQQVNMEFFVYGREQKDFCGSWNSISMCFDGFKSGQSR